MNREFSVHGIEGIETCIELLNEVRGGHEVRVTSTSSTGIRQSFEFISDELLESCVRTGFLVETQEQRLARLVLSA